MKKSFYVLLVLTCYTCSNKAVYTSGQKEFTIKIQNNEAEKSFYPVDLVPGLNNFAFSLYKSLNAGIGNVFISPYSISSALALAYLGAGGNTASQFSTVLAWNPDKNTFGNKFRELNTRLTTDSSGKKDYLAVANSIWMEKSLFTTEEYQANARHYLDAEISTVDFKTDLDSTRKIINAWIEDKTKNKIQDFISEGTLKPGTQLVLTNAVYYFAPWKKEFDKKKTANAPFNVSPSRQVSVPFMNDYEDSYRYYEDNNIKAVEIPYKNEKYSALFILPVETGGFLKAWDYFNADSFQNIIRSSYPSRVDISIPKFKISYASGLGEVLMKLGLTDAFSPNADFSAITGSKNLCFDEAIHKTFVEVNEAGTEAAAATGIFMRETAISPKYIKKFVADHPFVFIIKENSTQTILFMGQVFNPAR